MNIDPIRSFIETSAQSKNLKVKKAAQSLLSKLANSVQEVSQGLHAQEKNKPLDAKPKDEVDVNLEKVMPDLGSAASADSSFGKAASSFSADIEISKLPKQTQEDIFKFVPTATNKNRVVLYGMTAEELKNKVDSHNYSTATQRVKEEVSKKGKRALGDKFQDKISNKYILVINDKIIDGHHFLALADYLGISCSLKVLDLTPLRFQKTAALFDKLAYVLQHYRRQGAA